MSLVTKKMPEVSLREVINAETPVGTTSYRPMPHVKVIEAFKALASRREVEVKAVKYRMDPGGQRFVADYTLADPAGDGFEKRVVVGNSHRKDSSAFLIGGEGFWACSNGQVFGVEGQARMVHSRRATQTRLYDRFDEGLDLVLASFEEKERERRVLREVQIGEAELAKLLYRGVMGSPTSKPFLSSSDYRPVVDYFWEPETMNGPGVTADRHVYGPGTLLGLEHAVTARWRESSSAFSPSRGTALRQLTMSAARAL